MILEFPQIPDFLDVQDVLDVHEYELERFGGGGGVRDQALLESAVAMPSMTFDGAYLNGDLFGIAAAYLFHIAKNHAFIDGNKRTGLASALLFLRLNGLRLTQTPCPRLYDATIAVIEERMDKDELAELFRSLPWTEA